MLAIRPARRATVAVATTVTTAAAAVCVGIGAAPAATTGTVLDVVAGDGNYAIQPGAALSSGFYYASGVAADRQGNFYVLSGYEYAIAKVNAAGTLSVLAGDPGNNGTPTFDTAAAGNALEGPEDLAADAAGNVYIADYSRVVKVDTSGVLRLVAGTGNRPGWGVPVATGGAATSTDISVEHVAVGADGAVYGSTGFQVYKISGGTLTVIAGTGSGGPPTPGGPALASTFSNIKGLAVDGSGNVFVAESDAVYRIDHTTADLSVAAGTPGATGAPQDGPALSSPLTSPQRIAVDRYGDLYIPDGGARQILKVTGPATGSPTMAVIGGNGSWGSPPAGGTGPALSQTLSSPVSVAVGPSLDVYVADDSWNRVSKIVGVPTAPSAPRNFSATAAVQAASLTFDAPDDDGGSALTGYQISTDGGGTWNPLVTTGSGPYHANVSALSAGQLYTIKVRAKNVIGGSTEATATVTPTSPPPPPPPAPAPGPSEPSPSPSVSPTPSTGPTTPAPAPTPSAPTTQPLQLNLDLALQLDTKLVGATATLSGGGLMASSPYVLTMHSADVVVASGTTDSAGNFQAMITMPGTACVAGGLHQLVLTGTSPAGVAMQSSKWLVLDNTCTARAVSDVQPVDNTIALRTFLFPYNSARLTPVARAALNDLAGTIKTAGAATIIGYTQTEKTAPASIRANRRLALRRAKAVRDYLRRRGVRVPINTVGAGPVDPVDVNQQWFNRRVVINVRY